MSRKFLSCFIVFAMMAGVTYGYTQPGQVNTIPKFHIALTDSSYFNTSNLKKKQALMLVYFSPDCDHCHDFCKQVIADYNHFKDVQIVMISDHSIPELKKFETTYHLSKYKNIKVGTEGMTFRVRRHYQITKFPFIALFDKAGKELSVYRDAQSTKVICQTLKIPHPG